jgi:hypothetical protein
MKIQRKDIDLSHLYDMIVFSYRTTHESELVVTSDKDGKIYTWLYDYNNQTVNELVN